jgi:hypothetical protein
MFRNFRFAAAALAVAMLAVPVVAHHSAVQFDFTKSVSYKGKVKEFAAINPHMRLIIETEVEKKPLTIKFEGHSTNNMYRSGYRKGMIKVGDTITVNAAPLRDGTPGGYVVSVDTADGTFFGARSRNAAAAGEETRRAAEGR